jgi:CheY-like chemotaxis protein
MENTQLQASQLSVLVVDDDEFSLEISRKQLAFLGLTDIHTAADGLQAMRYLKQAASQPDFIICDIFMPEMDGIELVGELVKRAYPGGLILVTGVDASMLEVATLIATLKGLRLLGNFTKPLKHEALAKAMGLAQ